MNVHNKLFLIYICFIYTTLSASIVGATKGEIVINQGSANYAIKIDVPPGINGMTPKLSLQYNSTNDNNGYMGLGWSIGGISSISRCAQTLATDGKYHKFGVNYNSNDRFCLDGERLIALGGHYGANGTIYNTEINNYSKIVSKSTYHGGPRWFEVKTKDGLTYEYGLRNKAFLVSTRLKSMKFWKVDKIKDTYGNSINFYYQSNYKRGTHYIDKITYAGNTIQYIYESRHDITAGYHTNSPHRIDKRLKEVIVKAGSTEVRRYKIRYKNESTGSKRSIVISITEHVREGDLRPLYIYHSSRGSDSFKHSTSWINDFGSYKWKSIKHIRTMADMNGDGFTDIVGFHDSGVYVSLNRGGKSFASKQKWGSDFTYNNGWRIGVHERTLSDVNGDGLPDIVGFGNLGVYVALNTGHGFRSTQTWSHDYGSRIWPTDKYIRTLADVNGDGLPDIVGFARDYVYVSLNTGTYFKSPKKWSSHFTYNKGWRVGIHERMLSDINGDGLPDIIGFKNDGVYIALCTGNGFSGFHKWNNDFGSNIWKTNKHIRTLADVNGDGLPDIIGFGNGAVYVALNTGTYFKAPTSWTNDFTYNKHWTMDKHIRNLTDVNGDGLPDIVGFGNSAVYVALNTGNKFDTSRPWVQGFTYKQYGWRTSIHERLLPDITGDGLADIVGFGNYSVHVGINNKKFSLPIRMTNYTDQDIKLSYKPMTDSSIYHNYTTHGKRNAYPFNSINNDNIELTLPTSLVSSIKQLDGIGGYTSKRYFYYGYIANKIRGAQGFHAIYTYDDTHRRLDSTFYTQITKPKGVGFQYTGSPYLSYEDRDYDDNYKAMAQVNIVYKDASKRHGVYEPYTYSNIRKEFDPQTKSLLKTIYQYNYLSRDGFGNLTKKVVKTHDYVHNKDFYKTIYNTYAYARPSPWIIGKISHSRVVHSQTDGHTVVRASSFKYNANGFLSEEISNVGTNASLKKTYVYGPQGNKLTEKIYGSGVNRSIHYSYSSDHRFPVKINDNGLSMYKTYDARFGTPTSIQDISGVTTRYKYDGMGRKIEERRADGSVSKWTHLWYKGGTMNASYVYYIRKQTSGQPDSYIFYDSLGRIRTSYTYAMDNKLLRTSKRYFNHKGELYKEALPYISGEPIKYMYTYYDRFGRTIKITKPGPSNTTRVSTTSYNNFRQVLINPKGIAKMTEKNAIGQVVYTYDGYQTYNYDTSETIRYTYDAIGNLLSTKTKKNHTSITMSYDSAGNKIYVNNPDLGIWHYRYNARGQVVYKWDNSLSSYSYRRYNARGQILSNNTYNKREYNQNKYNYSYNRIDYTYNIFSNGTIGTRGKPILIKSRSRTKGENTKYQDISLQYDTLGRKVKETMTIDGKSYATSIRYDSFSRPQIITYPNGYKITNHYRNGILDYVRGSEGKIHYKINQLNAYGAVASARFGNDVDTRIGHDSAGYIGSIRSGRYGSYYRGDVQQMYYTYDVMGNVKTRRDSSISNKYINDTYTYDSLDRLTSQRISSNVSGAYLKSKTYRYDSMGNMTYQTGLGHYYYSSNKIHAVTQIGNTKKYVYDRVGNMTRRDGDTIEYNPLNKPSQIIAKNGSKVKFYYGVNQARFQKISDNNVITNYIGKGYEEEIDGNEKKQIVYITVQGKTVGQHVEKIDETYSINKSNPKYKQTYNRYFHTDALGSITSVTDDYGKVVERRSYDAFGKIRAMDYGLVNNHSIIPSNTVTETTRAFTGHEQIKEIDGLIHMNARVYDSDIGRFLSADTVIQDPLDSQAYNRYSYVRNNPLKYTDPTGHSWFSKAWKRFKKSVKRHWKQIVTIAVVAVVTVATGGIATAVAGAIGGSMGTIAAGATMGAIAGFTGGVVGAKLNGATWRQALKSGAKAAVIGAVSGGVAAGVVEAVSAVTGASSSVTHAASFLGKNKGVAAVKSVAHGLSRAAIAKVRGQSAKAAFFSGFASSGFSVGTTGYGGFVGRTTIMSIVGGTASAIAGGDFKNGAMTGAFTHMFNAENIVNKTKTFFKTVGATVSGLFGANIEIGYYNNNTEQGLLLTAGGTVGIDASVNVKAGYVNGNASTLDGWFTSATTSVGLIEATGMASNGNIVGASGGISLGFLPVTATVSQTYTVRMPIPLGSSNYKSMAAQMVED